MLPVRCRGPASRRIVKEGLSEISSIKLQVRLSSTAVIREKINETVTMPSVSRTLQQPQTPLAAMPTGMLLRSLAIATVSSHRYLLIPSLKLLSFFAKEGRSLPFNVDRNPILHAILKKTIYNQFCAGENLKEANACVQSLKDLGFKGVIMTFAKELVFDRNAKVDFHIGDGTEVDADGKAAVEVNAEIDQWRVGTLQTIDLLTRGDILAIKMSGAGPTVAHAFTNATLPPKQMLSALDEIATTCKGRGIQIIVDAESQHFQAGINLISLELMRKFNREKDVVIYNTYQAYLKKTPDLVASHMEEALKDGFTMGLKVVRGAYIASEERSLICDTKEDTDDQYNGIVRGALSRQFKHFGGNSPSALPFPALNLFLASHNRESVITARKLHQQRVSAGLPTVPVAFGQLHGMSDEVSFALLQEKDEAGASPDVYKCSTWGSMGDCIGYLLRRAVENRDAVLRTKDEFLALKQETARRARALFTS